MSGGECVHHFYFEALFHRLYTSTLLPEYFRIARGVVVNSSLDSWQNPQTPFPFPLEIDSPAGAPFLSTVAELGHSFTYPLHALICRHSSERVVEVDEQRHSTFDSVRVDCSLPRRIRTRASS